MVFRTSAPAAVSNKRTTRLSVSRRSRRTQARASSLSRRLLAVDGWICSASARSATRRPGCAEICHIAHSWEPLIPWPGSVLCMPDRMARTSRSTIAKTASSSSPGSAATLAAVPVAKAGAEVDAEVDAGIAAGIVLAPSIAGLSAEPSGGTASGVLRSPVRLRGEPGGVTSVDLRRGLMSSGMSLSRLLLPLKAFSKLAHNIYLCNTNFGKHIRQENFFLACSPTYSRHASLFKEE